MTNARELLEGRANDLTVKLTEAMIFELDVHEDDPRLEVWGRRADAMIARAMKAQVTQLEAQLAELRSRIAEQITHAETRIADGDEMGARVWRIALEDIARENRALLTQSKEPK